MQVGGDGCALLWRLTPKLAQRMQAAAVHCQKQLEQQAAQQAAMVRKQQQQALQAAAEPGVVHATPAAAPRRRGERTRARHKISNSSFATPAS